MKKLPGLTLAFIIVFGFIFSPDNGYAQRYRADLLDLCEDAKVSSACDNGHSRLNRYKGGRILANVGYNTLNSEKILTYLELTIRAKGSVKNAQHHVYLCDSGSLMPGFEGGPAGEFDDTSCERLIDEYTLENTLEEADLFPGCDEWPNTVTTNRNGNIATYLEWDEGFLGDGIDYDPRDQSNCPDNIIWGQNSPAGTNPETSTRLWREEGGNWRDTVIIYADVGTGPFQPVLGAVLPNFAPLN